VKQNGVKKVRKREKGRKCIGQEEEGYSNGNGGVHFSMQILKIQSAPTELPHV